MRDCNDCQEAYKEWLCSVTIPRCEDFSKEDRHLHPRAISYPFPNGDRLDAATLAKYPNITAYNSSRQPRIDEMIQPGPYKELLPCDDLCYRLVQSCPAALNFGCPRPDEIGFNTSYYTRPPNGSLMCNYQGSVHKPSGAGRLSPLTWGSYMIWATMAGFGLLVL